MTWWVGVIGPLLCGCIYFATSVAFLIDKRLGWALTYFAYAMSTVGLVWSAVTEHK